MTVPGAETAAPRQSAVGPDPAGADEMAEVAALLGREPSGRFKVVVRRPDGAPVVIENAPFLDDATPMPTRFWLVDPALHAAVSRLESDGAVRRAGAEVDAAAIADAHDRYAAERDALVPADHHGPRPSGGVGGTRQGVKCLHAHLAWWLAGGCDPVGRWTLDRLDPALVAGVTRAGHRGDSAASGPLGGTGRPGGVR